MTSYNRRTVLGGIVGLALGIDAAKAQADAVNSAESLPWPLGPETLLTPGTADQPQNIVTSNPNLSRLVGQALSQMQTIQPGMTRAQLETLFATAGGTYLIDNTPTQIESIYSFRPCPYFKIRVDYMPVRKAQRNANGYLWTPEDPQDVITKISKPFVEEVYSD